MRNLLFLNNVKRQLAFAVMFVFVHTMPAHAGWEVTWIERFDGASLDADNWTPQIQANFNNEIQCYTDDETGADRNIEVSDGSLKITARRQQINCPGQNGASRTWTSARLNSKDKAEFLYGRVEARIKFSELRAGTWPAFWMLGNRIAENPIKGDNDNINWPNPGAGEIDIWEWYSNSGDRYITNFFNANNCGFERRYAYPGGAPDVQSYHDYAMEWTADKIAFFINDIEVVEHDMTNCPQYEEPMFVLLNVAMGGSLGGSVDSSLNNATMEVDYVAHCVSSDVNNAVRCNESTPLVIDDDNDGVRNSLDECPATSVGVPVNSAGCEVFTQPQEAAPQPTLDAQNVISIYSDVYQSIANVNTNPDWQQATIVTEVQIQNDNTLKYAGLNYQGTDFMDNPQDLTMLNNLYVDYWAVDSTRLRIFLVSPGPVETSFDVNVERQSWQQLVIPLSTFSSVVDMSNVFQLKIEGNGTVYFDNIYFGPQQAAPPVDSDGDGVIDSQDQCANTPANVTVDAVGCEVVATPTPPPTPTPAPTPTPPPAPTPTESSSSGGSMSPFWIMCLFTITFIRRRLR